MSVGGGSNILFDPSFVYLNVPDVDFKQIAFYLKETYGIYPDLHFICRDAEGEY